jgi:hypothetical protein
MGKNTRSSPFTSPAVIITDVRDLNSDTETFNTLLDKWQALCVTDQRIALKEEGYITGFHFS